MLDGKYVAGGTMNLVRMFLFVLFVSMLSSVYANITLYVDSNYRGTSQALGVGKHNSTVLNKGVKINTTSSVKVPFGFKVTLYTGDNCTGSALALTADTASFSSIYNDKIKSVLVEFFPVTVYEHSNYGGVKQLLPVGQHDASTLLKGIGNDRISSVKMSDVGGKKYKVTLYADTGFKGASKTLTESTTYVGNDFNDKTSSLKIEELPKVVTLSSGTGLTGTKVTPPVGKCTTLTSPVVSMYVPKGYVAIIYSKADGKGNQFGLGAAESDMLVEVLPSQFNKSACSVSVTPVP
ncbi:MAG: hypothetical protein LBF56_02380 [Holosporales bacterium]|jgi:hypothetical protein|nr:hypothetical protein [Holosporales bacterium]